MAYTSRMLFVKHRSRGLSNERNASLHTDGNPDTDACTLTVFVGARCVAELRVRYSELEYLLGRNTERPKRATPGNESLE